MKRSVIYLPIILLVLLASCATFDDYNDFVNIQIGQSYDEVAELYPDIIDKEIYYVKSLGIKYKVIPTSIMTYYERDMTQFSGNRVNYKLDNFYMIFDNKDKLIFIGYPYEMKQQDSKILRDIETEL